MALISYTFHSLSLLTSIWATFWVETSDEDGWLGNSVGVDIVCRPSLVASGLQPESKLKNIIETAIVLQDLHAIL